MAGKWGSAGGGGMRLPASPTPYTAQITDVKKTISDKLVSEGKDGDQFEWGIDVLVNGKWEKRKVWTAQRFLPPDKITDPKFTPKLMKMVRACGMPFPRSQAEAEAWNENDMVGKQFGLLMQANPEDPSKIQDYYVPLPNGATQSAPAPASASVSAQAAPAEPSAPEEAAVPVEGDDELWN